MNQQERFLHNLYVRARNLNTFLMSILLPFPTDLLTCRRRQPMDIPYLALGIGFFALCWGFVALCERL